MLKQISKTQILSILIIILAILGLYVSMLLSIDKFELLKNADTTFGCGVSEKINCANVMKSDQASVFGFPNSFLGIMGYSFMLVTGVILLIGNFRNKIYLRLFNVGMLLSTIFSFWLLSQSIWVIKSLCPLCLVSWSVSTGIFLLITLYNIRYKILPFTENINWEKDKKNILTVFFCITFFVYFATIAILFSEYGTDIFKLINIKVYLP